MTDLPDERTLPGRRAPRPAEPVDERTAVSARHAAVDPSRAQVGPATMPPPITEGSGIPGPRRSGGESATPTDAAPESAEDAGAPADPVDLGDPDEGSTVVARRESRRREARAARAAEAARAARAGIDDSTVVVAPREAGRTAAMTRAADIPAPAARVAHGPAASAAYAARSTPPVVAPRLAPPSRALQQSVDTAAVAATARRRDRRLAVIVVIAASLVAVMAVTALIAVLVTG